MNKETKYAILYLNSIGKSDEQISKELKVDIADIKKAKTMLGWVPTRGIEDMVADTLAAFS